MILYVVAYSGNYAIPNCGEENTLFIQDLFDRLIPALLPPVQDAENTKGAAYRAFFKDEENGATISNILAKVSEDAPAYPDQVDAFTNGAPVIMCASKRGDLTLTYEGKKSDVMDQCKGLNVATTLSGTKWIVFCPAFWGVIEVQALYPPPSINGQPAANCLKLNDQRTHFAVTPDNRHGAPKLLWSKIWILFEELVHIYIDAKYLTEHHNFHEVADAQKALELSARDSLLNPPNYAMYVASR